jgi:hypothetical protein
MGNRSCFAIGVIWLFGLLVMAGSSVMITIGAICQSAHRDWCLGHNDNLWMLAAGCTLLITTAVMMLLACPGHCVQVDDGLDLPSKMT